MSYNVEELNHAGKGWFIVRLANELGVCNYNIDDNDAETTKTRERYFKNILPNAKEVLEDIILNKLTGKAKNTIRVEKLNISESDLYKLAFELYKKF